jgi:hypothetical protein
VAVLTITNATAERFYLPSMNLDMEPGQPRTVQRYLPDLERMPDFMVRFGNGDITVSLISIESWELNWRNYLAAEAGPDGAYALAKATRFFHEPTVTPGQGSSAPGQGPSELVIGSVLGLHFDDPSDMVYRIFKIGTNFIPGGPGMTGDGTNASFHVHWTKAVDTDQSGGTVRWQIEYTVFDGISEDIAVTPTVIDLDDTYIDSGTTSRIVHRTANVPAPGFIPGYYVGLCIGYDSGNTTLSGGPVVVSADLLSLGFINQGT